MVLQRGIYVGVSATYVAQAVRLALATLRTLRALKLRLLAALVLHVTLQRVFSHVRPAAPVAYELTAQPHTDVIAGLRYLQLGERQQRLILGNLHLHLHVQRQTREFLQRRSIHPVLALDSTWKSKKKEL